MTDQLQTIRARTTGNLDLSVPAPRLIGRFEFDMSTDQPSGSLPVEVLDAVGAALTAGQTHYVDVPGIGTLRELLAEHLRSARRAEVGADGIVVTAGVQEARFLAIQVLSESFPMVAVPDVVHPGVRNALGVRLPADLIRMRTSRASGHLAPVDEIARALGAGAKLIVVESPSRLTGAAYSGDEVRRIAELIADHEAHAILDDGFAPWSETSVASLAVEPAAAGRVTVIGEALPGIGLEAWSIGVLATNPELVPGITKLKQIMSICTSTPSQLAAIEVLQRGLADLEGARNALAKAREQLAEYARGMGVEVLTGECANVVALVGAVPVGAADGATFGAQGVARLRVDESKTAVVLQALAARPKGDGR